MYLFLCHGCVVIEDALFCGTRRGDQNWKPQWPLIGAYAPLVLAHLASMFSPLQPDPYLVTKFTFRPVLFNYLAFIAVPVNLIKSRRRPSCGIGRMCCHWNSCRVQWADLHFFPGNGALLGRAHPLGIFGISALEKYNELAEILVVTVPITLALLRMSTTPRAIRLLAGAAVFSTRNRSSDVYTARRGLYLLLKVSFLRIRFG